MYYLCNSSANLTLFQILKVKEKKKKVAHGWVGDIADDFPVPPLNRLLEPITLPSLFGKNMAQVFPSPLFWVICISAKNDDVLRAERIFITAGSIPMF